MKKQHLSYLLIFLSTILICAESIPQIYSPTQNTSISGSIQEFNWDDNGNTDVNQYWIEIGTQQGWNDIFGQNMGWKTSVRVSNIPTTGTLYVRLYYNNTNWDYVDYSYAIGSKHTAMSIPLITSPEAFSTLTKSNQTFYWNDNGSSNVNQYWIEIGTQKGWNDIYGKNIGRDNSISVSNLPTSGKIYVRLYYNNTNWDYIDNTYTMSTTPSHGLVRNFKIPLPLFSEESAWRQRADTVSIKNDSHKTIDTTYRVLMGYHDDLKGKDGKPNSPSRTFGLEMIGMSNKGQYSYPIYPASNAQISIDICEYTKTNIYNSVLIDAPLGEIRPAGPTGSNSDGHLILINTDTNKIQEFWRATGDRSGGCSSTSGGGIVTNTLMTAGSVATFNLKEDGVSPNGEYSANAAGTSLLAGLLLPEDFESNKINHALKFSIPGPRNLSTKGEEKLDSDFVYPASSTEDVWARYSKNKNAMMMGTRIRLAKTLVNTKGEVIDESTLSPATKMVLEALRNYGAYLTDNGGGFSFYAEDIHSGNLDVSNIKLNTLINHDANSPLPSGMTKWERLLSTIQEELKDIQIASGSANTGNGNPKNAIISHYNFEVVEDAKQ